ncbi:hypothetical protein P280DRAFT_477719 [Massarina eburnea CBS 473.64]|uniref:Uncharacterized protein n=1 Tax=Massarina eburnea CBS 473.64 TaxID=1395130 RepID=A0A6A6S907_9PLEO|nr:hypothetical protein P280DRAFT_477719 [Massarina eburnea CBS 473.64]
MSSFRPNSSGSIAKSTTAEDPRILKSAVVTPEEKTDPLDIPNTVMGSDPYRLLEAGLFGVDANEPPVVDPFDPQLRQIIDALMTPTEYMFSDDYKSVKLGRRWVILLAGRERFEVNQAGRLTLREDNRLFVCGVALGLAEEVKDWLREGGEHGTFPAEIFWCRAILGDEE